MSEPTAVEKLLDAIAYAACKDEENVWRCLMQRHFRGFCEAPPQYDTLVAAVGFASRKLTPGGQTRCVLAAQDIAALFKEATGAEMRLDGLNAILLRLTGGK